MVEENFGGRSRLWWRLLWGTGALDDAVLEVVVEEGD